MIAFYSLRFQYDVYWVENKNVRPNIKPFFKNKIVALDSSEAKCHCLGLTTLKLCRIGCRPFLSVGLMTVLAL